MDGCTFMLQKAKKNNILKLKADVFVLKWFNCGLMLIKTEAVDFVLFKKHYIHLYLSVIAGIEKEKMTYVCFSFFSTPHIVQL